jgi:hypothetical protein
MLGFETPREGHEAEWFARYQAMFSETPTTILVCSVGDLDLMA